MEMTEKDKMILGGLILFGDLPPGYWDSYATAFLYFNGVYQITIMNKYRQN